jgi:hypothetical protein
MMPGLCFGEFPQRNWWIGLTSQQDDENDEEAAFLYCNPFACKQHVHPFFVTLYLHAFSFYMLFKKDMLG